MLIDDNGTQIISTILPKSCAEMEINCINRECTIKYKTAMQIFSVLCWHTGTLINYQLKTNARSAATRQHPGSQAAQTGSRHWPLQESCQLAMASSYLPRHSHRLHTHWATSVCKGGKAPKTSSVCRQDSRLEPPLAHRDSTMMPRGNQQREKERKARARIREASASVNRTVSPFGGR